MSRDLPLPAEILRQSATIARGLAAAARLRGSRRFAADLEQRAAIAEAHADYLDERPRLRSETAERREILLIEAHEAAIRERDEAQVFLLAQYRQRSKDATVHDGQSPVWRPGIGDHVHVIPWYASGQVRAIRPEPGRRQYVVMVVSARSGGTRSAAFALSELEPMR